MNKFKTITISILIILISLSAFIINKSETPENPEIKEPEVTESVQEEETTVVKIPESKKEVVVIEKKKQDIKPKKTENKTQVIEKEIVNKPIETKIDVEKPIESKIEPLTKLRTFDSKRYTTEPELIEALYLLEDSGETSTLKNIQKYAMRIKFDDFSHVYYNKDAYFAMTAYNRYGTRLLLINSYYKTAPTEQLACLIVHESMHTKLSPTFEEENLATQKEAACWKNLKSYSKTYPDTKLSKSLDKLLGNSSEEISKKIARTELYKEQFKLDK